MPPLPKSSERDLIPLPPRLANSFAKAPTRDDLPFMIHDF
jgi:hypothetical protein